MSDFTDLIEAIHATPTLIVLDFAGAGSQALAWLHSVGGSSRTILEATDRYSAASLIDLIGFKPKQFTTPEVAEAMARRAFWRASCLAAPCTPVAGIGSTATITTDRAKRGDHRVFVAWCDANGIKSYGLTLKKGLRSREEEEQIVSQLILKVVAEACGLSDSLTLNLIEDEHLEEAATPTGLLDRLLDGEISWFLALPDGQQFTGERLPGMTLLSGSFNPLHQGHRQLAEVAESILGRRVTFELPLLNAEKAPLAAAEASRRIAQFKGYAPLLLTRAPLFSQKAELFPGSVFVVGIDTAMRILQLRFYHHDRAEMDAALQEFRAASCRFLVAGRLQDGHFLTLADIDLPPAYQDLFEAIPASHFRADISSTAIRQGVQQK